MKRTVFLTLVMLAALLWWQVSYRSAQAVSFTMDLTGGQINTIQWKWNRVDPPHTTYATGQLFAAAQFDSMIQEWQNQRAKEHEGVAPGCILWNAASQATKDLACAAAGESAGCTRPGC